MKKRTFIAIIITIITIIATNKYWLVIKPLPVNFDIQGYGSCYVEVQLNKKDNDEFKKIKSELVYVNLEENKHIDIVVKKAIFPKRIKVILSNINSNKPITISNFQFRDGKYTLNNLEKFKVDGAEVTIQDNSLILTPNSDNITLVYPDTLHVMASVYIDFMIFSIILILTYLLAYKLTNYVAEFHTIKDKSRIEVIFLTIFFVLLTIPMSHINHDEISKQENRTLAKWKPIILENNVINFKFGKDFNEWFNDRFYIRDKYINNYYEILSAFSTDYYEDKNIIYNKQADFSYYKGYNSINRFQKKDLFSEQELNTIYQNLYTLEKYCNDNNVKFYLILSNDKESIYPEFYPVYYKQNDNLSRLEQTKQLLQKIPNLNVISQQEALLDKKKDSLVFLPYDTHLNSTGIQVEYHTIISELKKTYPFIKPLDSKIETVITQNRCDSAPPAKYINEKYKYADGLNIKNPVSINKKSINFESKSYHLKEFQNDNAGNKLNVVIVGDSFHDRYLSLLAEHFYSVNSLYVSNGNDFILDAPLKKILFKEKPDILFIETTERFLPRLLQLDSFLDIFESKYRSN